MRAWSRCHVVECPRDHPTYIVHGVGMSSALRMILSMTLQQQGRVSTLLDHFQMSRYYMIVK